MVSEKCLNTVEKVCKDYWKYYDLVCYLGIEFPIVADGVRSEDEDLRKQVDSEIFKQILWNKVRAIQLSGTVLQRVSDLQNAVNSIYL